LLAKYIKLGLLRKPCWSRLAPPKGNTVPVASAWALSSVWQLAQANFPLADKAFSANKAWDTLNGVAAVAVGVLAVDEPPQPVSQPTSEAAARILAKAFNVKTIPLWLCE